MGKLVIKRHDFENAKNELKKFSEQTTTDLDLKRVDDSKGLGEFLGDWILGRGIGLNHKVTGEELNDLTAQIQMHLHSVNNTQIILIKEFGQVYSALEALDQDYIQAILVSIRATEKTSQSIQETQGQINKIVAHQKKALEELKKFKQKLDSYAHLGDIDNIWSNCQKWYEEINTLSKSIESAADFTYVLEQVTHLKDVDDMWESLSSAHASIRNISDDLELIQNAVSKHQEDINNLLSFMDSNESEINHLKEYKEKLSNMSASIQKNKEEVDIKIADAIQEKNVAIESITKRIKYAYLIAGGSAGLAIIELFLLFIKVI